MRAARWAEVAAWCTTWLTVAVAATGATTATVSHTVPLRQPGSYQIDLTTQTLLTNKSVTIRNAGTGDLNNPWLVANGRGDWFDVKHIAAEAAGDAHTPEQRAWNIWHFMRRSRYHWYPAEEGVEVQDVTKFLNVYGYGFCDDSATALECLWELNGLPARSWLIKGHIISEVDAGSGYQMLDADRGEYFPTMDMARMASVEECEADPSLVSRVSSSEIAELYRALPKMAFRQGYATTHTMAMRLRPGESLERSFTHRGLYHDDFMQQEPPAYGNGRLRYHTDFESTAVLDSFAVANNVVAGSAGAASQAGDKSAPPAVRIRQHGIPALLTWRMESPYPLVGGRVSVEAHLATSEDRLRVAVLRPGHGVHVLGTVTGPAPRLRLSFPLDDLVARTSSPACYQLDVRVGMTQRRASGSAGLYTFEVEGDIQCAPESLPALHARTVNDVAFRMAPSPGAVAEITHTWRDGAECPFVPAPTRAVHPADGDTITTTAPVLAWGWDAGEEVPARAWREVAVFSDAEGIIPVAPPVNTVGDGDATFALPDGWLLPGRTYYWRVCTGNDPDQRGPLWRFGVK